MAFQAPLSMEFPRQEYESGLVAICSSGDLPHPGTEPASLASSSLAGGFFTTAPPGKPASSHGPSISISLCFPRMLPLSFSLLNVLVSSCL